jgi:energy-converting hydrogenase Eha subunit A
MPKPYRLSVPQNTAYYRPIAAMGIAAMGIAAMGILDLGLAGIMQRNGGTHGLQL